MSLKEITNALTHIRLDKSSEKIFLIGADTDTGAITMSSNIEDSELLTNLLVSTMQSSPQFKDAMMGVHHVLTLQELKDKNEVVKGSLSDKGIDDTLQSWYRQLGIAPSNNKMKS